MANPVILPSRTFKSVAELRTWMRSIWRRGECIITDEEERKILNELVTYYHDHPDKKIGCGIERFEVRTNENYKNTKCFYIVRTDGTFTDVSFGRPSYRRQVLTAMRNEVANQSIAARREAGRLGDLSVHVDHAERALVTISEDFLQMKGLKIEDIMLQPTEDRSSRYLLADRILAVEWLHYHKKNAKLEIIDKRANLSKGAR